jgi:hypothetical protein
MSVTLHLNNFSERHGEQVESHVVWKIVSLTWFRFDEELWWDSDCLHEVPRDGVDIEQLTPHKDLNYKLQAAVIERA